MMASLNLCHTREDITLNDGIKDVFGSIYERLGFEKLIQGTRKDKHWNALLKCCVLARFLEPSSKLRAVDLILNRFQEKFTYDQVLRIV